MRSWLRTGVYTAIGFGVVTMLVALFVPAVEKVRDGAARTQSTNNLKQIGLACQTFHDMNKRLPFNGSDASPVKRRRSSTAKMLSAAIPERQLGVSDSFVHRSGSIVHRMMDPKKRWNTASPPTCAPDAAGPVRGQTGPWTDYFLNNYLNDPLQAARPDAADARRTLAGITDGTSNTILSGQGNINTAQYALNANVAWSSGNIFARRHPRDHALRR